MTRLLKLALLLALAQPVWAATYFIRADGGNRYSSNVPYGLCNGQADAAYPGTTDIQWAPGQTLALNFSIVDSNGDYEKVTAAGTTNTTAPAWPAHGSSGTTTADNSITWTSEGAAPYNQSCAWNDWRYTYDDGTYGNFAWAISGGDTVVIRSCRAALDQQNPSNPNCRVGVDLDTGTSGSSGFCVGSQPNTNCFNPTIPAGTSGAHTKILGGCAYDGDCVPVLAVPYTGGNLTQLFGGFGAGTVLNASGTSYVDFAGLEITSHNGTCSRVGAPNYPTSCSTSSPISDYVTQGVSTSDTASNLTFTDINEHGVNSNGFYGSIGGPISMTRVIVVFNALAGYDFDDGNADAAGSSITASYVWMEGNGCQEQFPIVNASFPALACWDTNSAGFGDSWSGQTTNLVSFTGDHLTTIYNTKDGFIGPHTLIQNLSLTHSQWYGNMGSQLKWGTQNNGSTLFQDNFVNGNCNAMSVQIPGAAQNFNQSTSQGGSYLTNYCRASGATFAISSGNPATFLAAGNTIISDIAETTLELTCVDLGSCTTTNWQFTDNIFLGYAVPASYGPFGGGYLPAIYYNNDTPTNDIYVTSTNNLFYGNRNDDCAGGTGGVVLTSVNPICASPSLAGQPSSYSSESVFFPFIPVNNLYPNTGSAAIHAGVPVAGMTDDYYGNLRPTPPAPPSVGFAETVGTPTGVVLSGGIVVSGSVIIQ